jgi:hypothetical protein
MTLNEYTVSTTLEPTLSLRNGQLVIRWTDTEHDDKELVLSVEETDAVRELLTEEPDLDADEGE